MAEDKKQVIQLVSTLDDTGFKKAKQEVSGLAQAQAKQTAQTEKGSASMLAFGAAAAVATTAIIAAKKSFDFFAQSVEEFSKAQRSEMQLENALRSTGKAAIFTADELKAMAAEFQRFSTVGDDTIMEAQAIALRFEKLGREDMPRLIRASIDVAAAMGTDVASAVQKLGRAIEDPIQGMTALTRQGIVFDQQQQDLIRTLVASGKELEAQDIILRRVEAAFGGSAQAEIATYAGQVKQLKNSFGDLQEVIGGALVPYLGKGVALLKEFVDAAQYFAQGETATRKYAESLDAINELQAKFNEASAAYAKVAKDTDEADRLLEIAAGYQRQLIDKKALLAASEKEMQLDIASKAAKREQMVLADKANAAERKAAAERAALAEQEKRTAEVNAKARYDVRVKGIDRELEYARQMASANTDEELNQYFYKINKEIELEETRLEKAKEIAEQQNMFNEEQNALYLAQFQYLEEQKATVAAQYRARQEQGLRSLAAVDKWLLTERAKNFQSTMSFISSLASSENSNLAAIGKAAAIANATISTYEAANKALASAPPPFNFILAAAVTAAGMANVANIVGVKLAKGGLVSGSGDGVAATIGEGGKDEAVLPLERPSTMRRLGEAIASNIGGGGATIYQTINLTPSAGLTMAEITQAIKDGNAQAQELAKVSYKAGAALEGNA